MSSYLLACSKLANHNAWDVAMLPPLSIHPLLLVLRNLRCLLSAGKRGGGLCADHMPPNNLVKEPAEKARIAAARRPYETLMKARDVFVMHVSS